MKTELLTHLAKKTEDLKAAGLFKEERIITSQQQADIRVEGSCEVINLCANNYLGLSNNQTLIDAAHASLDRYGFGMSSVRFICGTLDIHKELESALSDFLGMEDTILYSSCFDANGGLFETLMGPEDAIISDALNHASIIDGVRLSKARRFRYANNDMEDLETQLKAARDARFILISTDGVFSMDGTLADLSSICDLADAYGAYVMVDDSHAVGFTGETGRGTPELCGVMGRVDIITGTLGKALGGASGGYTSAKREVIEWLRQRSRPYLFSNTLAPVVTATSIAVLKMLKSSSALIETLKENTRYFRDALEKAGFNLVPGNHAIIPVMLGDATLAREMAHRLLGEGIYVIGFSFPVVPKGKARIRTQMSAGHTRAHLDKAITAFTKVGKELGVID
ncbi:glycine C-acetyltransferase [Desulfoluna sp.]|uniref:glycine C-acetyltransferase n=1 Tax=Desulfoluna sp. TaxID=2045199 RepID=UPI002631CC9D|nr:glycine C-acetyltransferase [Desulfoluna sp.]